MSAEEVKDHYERDGKKQRENSKDIRKGFLTKPPSLTPSLVMCTSRAWPEQVETWMYDGSTLGDLAGEYIV